MLGLTHQWSRMLSPVNIKDVVVVNEFGESQTIVVDEKGTNTIRLVFRDRFSTWPLTSWLPLHKSGQSTHRIYFSVEKGNEQRGYDKWAIIVYKDAKVESTVEGLCSNRFYRRTIIQSLERFDDSSFGLLAQK